MDVKKLLKGTAPFETRPELSLDKASINAIDNLRQQYQQVSSQLKQAQESKRAIARQFKEAKQNPSRLVSLKEQMTVKSQAVTELEHQLNSHLKRAKEIFDSQMMVKLPYPEQFHQPERNYTEKLTFEYCSIDDFRWHTFVGNHRAACAYHQPAIQSVIAQSFGYTSKVLLAVNNQGDIIGGLPLTFLYSKLFGDQAVSAPFFNYGGPLTYYRNVAETLITEARAALAKHRVAQIEIRTTMANLGEVVSDKKVSMLLRLPTSESELDKNLGSKVRAQYNKANGHQPAVRFGDVELLNDFYRVFSTNMRDLGTPVYSKQWFRNLLQESRIQSHLVVCYVDRKPVSCGFLLGYRGLLEIPWASTMRKANHLNMNMWMYRQILGFAIRQGYQFFDFGRSTKDANTYRFKKQWGAEPIQHFWYYINNSGEVSSSNPDNPKFKLVIAIWKKLPVWFTNLIGPAIVKQIP